MKGIRGLARARAQFGSVLEAQGIKRESLLVKV